MRPDAASNADFPSSQGQNLQLGFELPDDAWLLRIRKAITEVPGRLGEYEVVREIGRGGQGIVYQARQPNTGRLVALKRVSTGVFASEESRLRFLREVEALAALDHPNIVTVFGSENIDGQPLLVIKWVDGVSISQWADGREREEIIAVFLGVCDAIQHAHQRGIVHRDLKPSNILVDKANRPHVLDFGLAKLIDTDDSSAASLTRTSFVGTLAYAAPEQFRGCPTDIDTRTDVYALGAVLHQLLTGRAPLTDLGHRPAPGRGGREFSRELPGELEAIVFKALSPEKEFRISSVEALANDLRRYLAKRPVDAYSTGTAYRLGKFIRRNRWVSGLTGIAAVLLVYLAIRSTRLAGKLAHEVEESKTSALREHEQRVRSEELARAARDYGNEAARHAAQNQAASEFLSGLLSGTTSPVDGKSSAPPDAVLELAARQLDQGALQEQPDAEYALRFKIGIAYERQKQYESARQQFEAAVALARRLFGNDHANTSSSLSHLGVAQRGTQRLEEAERSLREAIAIVDKNSPGQAGATWLGELAQTLHRRGNHTDAEFFYKRATETWTRTRGTSNQQAAVAWQQLAREQAELAKWRDAEASARISLAAWDAVGLPPDNNGLCLKILGHAMQAQDNFAEAAKCYQRVLSEREGSPGASKCLAQVHFHLAAALLGAARDEEGNLVLIRAVSRCKAAEPGHAEFDTRARRAESALRANGFHVDSNLLPLLGDLDWLVSSDIVLRDQPDAPMSTSAPGEQATD